VNATGRSVWSFSMQEETKWLKYWHSCRCLTNGSWAMVNIAPSRWLIFCRVDKYDVAHVDCSVVFSHKLQNNLHAPILQSPSESLTYIGITSYHNTCVNSTCVWQFHNLAHLCANTETCRLRFKSRACTYDLELECFCDKYI